MKKTVIVAIAWIWTAGAAFAGPAAEEKPKPALKTEEDKVFYLLGASLGQNIEQFTPSGPEIRVMQLGLADYLAGRPLQVDPQEYNPKIAELAKKRQGALADKEKKKAKEFVEKALKEKGAEKFPSGLVLIPIKEGTGANPAATDKVKVHYHGTLTDGSIFDSSVQRNQPAEFPLNGVIPCWTEGVQKIKVGGKAKLLCPSDIAYGDQGRPPRIPGGATLVFEVELLDILK